MAAFNLVSSDDPRKAREALGATDVGDALFTADGQAAAQEAIGVAEVVEDLAFDPADVGYDIVLIAGQSNAVGQVAGSSALDTVYLDPPDARILQWPATGSYAGLGRPIGAVDPLFGWAQQAGCVGPAMSFAREVVRRLKPNRKILLVPAARGGTGFTTSSQVSPPSGYSYAAGGGWDTSGGQGGIDLYQLAIAQANNALASGENNRVLCAIWVQGEADGLTQSAYAAHLDALIDGLRSNITGAEDMPVLISQMVPGWIAYYANAQHVNAAQVDTPRRKLLTAFNYGVTDLSLTDGLTPPLHYTNEGQRRNGANLAAMLDFATANVLGTAPVTPGAVSVAQSGTSVTATWVRTVGRVTDYNVRYRVNGGSWTALTRAQSIDNTATITGLSSGQTVDVQVAAVNEEGTSAWSASGSLAMVYAPGQPTAALGTPLGTSIPYTITAPTVDGTHSAAASYLVEYKAHSSGTWLTFGTVTGLTGSVTALAYQTQYDVRVTATNAAGSGTASSTQTATTAASTALIDDVGVSAYRAFGLRRLRAAYSGSAIRVRYTDATEADIGFASGTNDLDTTTLLAGASAHGGSAYIKTWYDQSGNSRNATQSTTGAQARIVNSNTLDTKGANTTPAAVFSSSYYTDTGVGLYAAGAASWLGVLSSSHSSIGGICTERGSGSMNYNMGYHNNSDGKMVALINDDTGTTFATANSAAALTDATLSQLSYVDTGTALQVWIDAAGGSAGSYTRSGHTLTLTTHCFGCLSTAGGSPLAGQVAELVEFAVALTSTQRGTGQANQKTYYGTA